MRSILFPVLLFFFVPARAQHDTLYGGVDSLRGFMWMNDVLTLFADDSGNTAGPADYTRTEYYLALPDLLVLVNLKTGEEFRDYNFPVPKEALRKIKTEGSSFAAVPELKNATTIDTALLRPDSVLVVDTDILEKYAETHTEGRQYDTVYFNTAGPFEAFTDWTLSGRKGLRSVTVYRNGRPVSCKNYYPVHDLDGRVLKAEAADHLLLQRERYWKKGRPQGRWKTYAPDGRPLSLTVYRRGKVVRIVNY